jgi:hypothetical protein
VINWDNEMPRGRDFALDAFRTGGQGFDDIVPVLIFVAFASQV